MWGRFLKQQKASEAGAEGTLGEGEEVARPRGGRTYPARSWARDAEQTWGFDRLASETQRTPVVIITKVLTVTIVTFIALLPCAQPLYMDYFISPSKAVLLLPLFTGGETKEQGG